MIKKKEFIGKKADIQYNGTFFTGKIIDETKNLFFIETRRGVKKIIKTNAVVVIEDNRIDGKEINKRPEERIKVC